MKTLLFIMMLAATLQAKAGDNDTLRINKPGNVTIITGDSLQKIIVTGKEGDDNFRYQNTIQLVDSNYVSTTRIGRDRWELIPSVEVGKRKDGTNSRGFSNSLSAHFGIGFTAPTKADTRTDFSTFKSRRSFSLQYSGTTTSTAWNATPCRWASDSTGRTTA